MEIHTTKFKKCKVKKKKENSNMVKLRVSLFISRNRSSLVIVYRGGLDIYENIKNKSCEKRRNHKKKSYILLEQQEIIVFKETWSRRV